MSGQLSLLNYYIPLGAQLPNGERLPSPCPALYPRAVHLDGSNWVIRHDLIPWNLLNDIVSAGGRFWTYKFDQSEQPNLLRDATESITKELKAAQKRLEESLASIDEKDTTDGGGATWRIRQQRTNQRKQCVKRLTTLATKLETASKLYGIDTTESLKTARGFANALTRNNYQMAAVVADLAKQVEGTAMEAAAKSDEVPVGILADYVEENGGDVTAARQAIEAVEKQNESTPVYKVNTLVSKGRQWSIRYEVNCAKAKVIRTHKGNDVETLTMTVEEARSHYAANQALGYQSLDLE